MINGIDVYHNTSLTPQVLTAMAKNHSMYFMFVKASTGANGKDARFIQNWQMGRNAGLLCAGYHWFWPASDPALQANNFLSQYRQVSRAGVLPPAVDIEWTWNANVPQTTANELWNQVAPAARIGLIRQFLDAVEQALNVKPVIYTANSFWNELIAANATPDDNAYFSSFPLWIADPNANKKIPAPWASSGAAFTQNHFGVPAGPGADPFGAMDQDVYNGSLKQLLNSSVPGLTFMKGFPFSQIVTDMQQALKDQGLLTDIADGLFGNNTAAAVTAFQQANGLTGNGIVDAQTWNKLLQ